MVMALEVPISFALFGSLREHTRERERFSKTKIRVGRPLHSRLLGPFFLFLLFACQKR